MVKITMFQNQESQIVGFDCIGHAEFSEENDVVCSAISALVINCMNSIEALTGDLFTCESDEEAGMISFRLEGESCSGSQLLLQSLALGLEELENNYEAFIDVIFEEV